MGIKKKVSLIRALAVKSDILVLVEPIFTLDNKSKNELFFIIASYISPSTAVICTSHDGEFINTFPDYNIISFTPGETV